VHALCADKTLDHTSPADRFPKFISAGPGAIFRRWFDCKNAGLLLYSGGRFLILDRTTSHSFFVQALTRIRNTESRARTPVGSWGNEQEVQVHRKDFSCLATVNAELSTYSCRLTASSQVAVSKKEYGHPSLPCFRLG